MEAPPRSSEFRRRQADDWYLDEPNQGLNRGPGPYDHSVGGLRGRWQRPKTPQFVSRFLGGPSKKRWDSVNPLRFDKRRWLRLGMFAISGSMILGIVLFALAWMTIDLPKDVPLSSTTLLTDAKGARLATFNAGENRVPVKLADIPQEVQRAVTDTEDRNFFEHKGIDPKGIARAVLNDARGGGNLQGGSTITQQYVKTQYVGQERTATRKFKEIILAMKLENKMSKEEIFERYLNAIYFGRGAYGVEAASRTYFKKSANQLSLKEASYLAGLIRAPEAADVYKDPKTAEVRRNRTLDNMARFGSITPEQSAEVKATDLKSYVVPRTAIEPTIVQANKGTQYFVDYVRRMLVQEFGEETVDSGGLQVKTTLDLTLQAHAYDSVYGFLKPGEPAGALVSVNQNGEIKAMVGGRDHAKSEVNLAVGRQGGGSGRQAGSTFKPFALAAALEEGTSLRQTYPGPAKKTFDHGTWQVSNFDKEAFGRINLVDATVHSVNTVYAQLAIDEGPDKIVAMAHSAGVTSELKPVSSVVLGSENVSPLEMAEAYMTFGLRGRHVPSTAILEVKKADGSVVKRWEPRGTQVMEQNTADSVNYALQEVVRRGTATKARANINKPLAGKTGTTENHVDAWFVGYTPTLSTAVWVGYPEGGKVMDKVRGAPVTGGGFPAQIFNDYMRFATKDAKATKFTSPKNLGDLRSGDSRPAASSTTATTNPDEGGGGKPKDGDPKPKPRPTTTTTERLETIPRNTFPRPRPTSTTIGEDSFAQGVG